MARSRTYRTAVLHPLVPEIEKEVWWNLRGQATAFTLRRLASQEWRCSLTAVNQKGDAYYCIVTAPTLNGALDLLTEFIETGNKSIARWRRSDYQTPQIWGG